MSRAAGVRAATDSAPAFQGPDPVGVRAATDSTLALQGPDPAGIRAATDSALVFQGPDPDPQGPVQGTPEVVAGVLEPPEPVKRSQA